MTGQRSVPRILVIDDLLGRQCREGRNEERAGFCGSFLVSDITGDKQVGGQRIQYPVAEGYFHRGQKPVKASIGDTVSNDLEAIYRVIDDGWSKRRPEQPPWSLVLLDLCFSTGLVTNESETEKGQGMPVGCADDWAPGSYFGLTVLEQIHTRFPELPVAVLSSRPRESAAERFSQLGAVDFLASDEKEPASRLQDVIRHHALIPDDGGAIVGHSIPLLVALREARRAAAGSQSVLILGEPGTGKELVARYINRHRSRTPGTRPFVPVNCSALTSELYSSELFGHEKGAFTGAVSQRKGAIRAAEGGDLFLDEVGDMPDYVQRGLLRALEVGEVHPLGRDNPVKIKDVSFVFATNRNLDALCAEGRFRDDLLDRIRSGKTVRLCPLRERREDIPLLVEALLRNAEKRFGAEKRSILPEVVDALQKHDWPGNVRQLDSCIRGAVADYPKIERLALVHLRIGGAESVARQQGLPTDLASVVQALERVQVDSLGRDRLSGALADLEQAYAQAAARLIKVGLERTKDLSGEMQYTPAMKLLMNRPKLRTAQAADLIKRFLSISESTSETEDQTLAEALKRARDLRNKK